MRPHRDLANITRHIGREVMKPCSCHAQRRYLTTRLQRLALGGG